MRQKKAVLIMLVIVVLLAIPGVAVGNPLALPPEPSETSVPAWSYTMLGERVLTRRHIGLDIRGTVPYICATFDAAPFINSHVDDYVVPSLVTEANRLRARAITFGIGGYHPTEDVISVVIYADVAATLPHTLVRSVNFCSFTGDILNMNEATGMEIRPLAERILTEKIRGNPERYYAALNSQLPDAFYLTDERLVIIFDGFSLSTRVSTPDTLELVLENIFTRVLNPGDYRPNGPYGLKMIPVSTARRLGYHVRLVANPACGRDSYVVIARERNGVPIVEFTPGDNEYIIHGTQRRSLEAAPQMVFNRIRFIHEPYVPITFFDQILPNTTYTIGWDGSITFLAYFED